MSENEQAAVSAAAFFASVDEPDGELDDLIRRSNLAAYAEVMCFRCWCGADVRPREPGDLVGLGCTADLRHSWRPTPTTAETP